MDHNIISSDYSDLSVINDVISLVDSQGKYLIEIKNIEKIAFKNARGSNPGYIKFDIAGSGTKLAYFNDKESDQFELHPKSWITT